MSVPTEDPGLVRVLGRARDLGLLGPGPVRPHLEHAAGAAERIAARWGPTPASVDGPLWAADLGSGGGLPGLPLAVAFPSIQWRLIDAAERRIAFLEWAITELGLAGRVEAVRGRAEVIAHAPEHRGRYDLVTARSFGPPATTAECAVGLLRSEGALLVSEPPEPDPTRWPAGPLASLGLEVVGSGPWMEARRTGPLDPSLPRREGVPAKRPRW